jgi:hypothetical protein
MMELLAQVTTNAESMLSVITLAISGWTLKSVISLREDVVAIKQQVKDLPCKGSRNCPDAETKSA